MASNKNSAASEVAKTQVRVRRMEARKIEGGARRMPGGLLQARAAAAAQALIANGFAPNITQAINQALIDCALETCPHLFESTEAEKKSSSMNEITS